ncbi:MAG: PAS domain-containing protein, partial [Clostridiales bacterium]|nr:PAS domain-containing protein [Clostridiales bacterium]
MENKEEFLKRRIIDDMSEGVIIINFDGEIVLLNHAAEQILGMTQGELKNKTIAELISTSDEKDELFELILDVIYTR